MGRADIQGELDRREECTNRNLIKFMRTNAKSCMWERRAPGDEAVLGSGCPGSCSAGRALVFVEDSGLKRSPQSAPAAWQVVTTWASLIGSQPADQTE